MCVNLFYAGPRWQMVKFHFSCINRTLDPNHILGNCSLTLDSSVIQSRTSPHVCTFYFQRCVLFVSKREVMLYNTMTYYTAGTCTQKLFSTTGTWHMSFGLGKVCSLSRSKSPFPPRIMWRPCMYLKHVSLLKNDIFNCKDFFQFIQTLWNHYL